jgi:hypothetical protein
LACLAATLAPPRARQLLFPSSSEARASVDRRASSLTAAALAVIGPIFVALLRLLLALPALAGPQLLMSRLP